MHPPSAVAPAVVHVHEYIDATFTRAMSAGFLAKPRMKIQKEIGAQICGEETSRELTILTEQSEIGCTCRRTDRAKAGKPTETLYTWSFKKKDTLELLALGDAVTFSQISATVFRMRITPALAVAHRRVSHCGVEWVRAGPYRGWSA
jgi:hypothetical protein